MQSCSDYGDVVANHLVVNAEVESSCGAQSPFSCGENPLKGLDSQWRPIPLSDPHLHSAYGSTMLIRATAQKVVPLGYSLVLGYDNTLIGLFTANEVPCLDA